MRLPRRRSRLNFSKPELEALESLKEAYSSLQVAFEGSLIEGCRALGIEMMASMSQVLAARLMVSQLESQFWHNVMAELTAQKEFDRLKLGLSGKKTILNFPRRWLIKRRMRVLSEGLKRLGERLALIETTIQFVNPPRARNKNWRG